MGAFTVTFRGRFRVVPEGKSDAETRGDLLNAFDYVGVAATRKALADVDQALDGRARGGLVVAGGGLTVRYDASPFNPVTEVTEVKTIN
jgi:hypothetical protein